MLLNIGTDAYTSKSLVYEWQNSDSVTFVPGMTLSQFDLISMPQRNFTFTRREGRFDMSFGIRRDIYWRLSEVKRYARIYVTKIKHLNYSTLG